MTAVEVFLDRNGESVLVGRAHFTRMRGRISTTFLYDPDYLVNGGTTSILRFHWFPARSTRRG